MARLGIDLSGDSIALADVRQGGARLQLRAYAILDPVPDRTTLTGLLRRVRDEHRFPLDAEVVAWAGEPRVSAVRAAGYRIERVILPGEALARVSRLHRGLDAQPSGEVIALVSLDRTSGAMAIVRDSTVLYEAPLTWSSNAAPGPADAKGADLLRRYAFLFELTELLHAAFGSVQRSHGARVSTILTCGGLPELRSLTMPLSEEFDVGVEALESATSLDMRRLKGHTRDEAGSAVAALQIAIAASRRWHVARSPGKRALRIALPLGVAVAAYGLYAGGLLYPPESAQPARRPASPGPSSRQGSPTKVPGGVVGSVMGGLPDAPPPPPPIPADRLRAPGPSRAEARAPSDGTVPEPPNTSHLSTTANVPTPVSLSLTSILWSSQRQLAILEGQVLGVGDSVAGMKIVEIRPDCVILRDRASRLRRVDLPSPRPSGSD